MPEEARCRHCGGVFLPPSRPGEYRCSRCGKILFADAKRPRPSRTSAPLLYCLASVAAGVGVWLMLPSRTGTTSARPPLAREAGQPLPPEVYRSEPADPASLGPTRWTRDARSRRARVEAELCYRHAWDRARRELPEPDEDPNARTAVRFYAREEWEIEVERWVAGHARAEIVAGLKQARRALDAATTAADEDAARETLGRGQILIGEYDAAIATLRPLAPLLYPPRPQLLLRRAYRHRGLPLETSEYRLWIADPFAFDETEASRPRWLARSLDANLTLSRRRPRDPALHLRVGWQYLDLAQARAAEEPGFPHPGPGFGRRVSRYVAGRYPTLIASGIAHCETASRLAADQPGLRARALEGLGHGYLMQRRFDLAIHCLEQSLALVPTLAQARDDLRQAGLRQRDPPPQSRRAQR